MVIENDKEGSLKLRLALSKLTKSYSRRGVAFVISAHSKYVANLTMLVTGKRGTAQKSFVIIYDEVTEEWVAYSDGYSYRMLSLSEISMLVKNKIQKLHTVLTKI